MYCQLLMQLALCKTERWESMNLEEIYIYISERLHAAYIYGLCMGRNTLTSIQKTLVFYPLRRKGVEPDYQTDLYVEIFQLPRRELKTTFGINNAAFLKPHTCMYKHEIENSAPAKFSQP